MFEVWYMCDKAGELLGTFDLEHEAMICYWEHASDMDIENAADLRVVMTS